MKKRILLLTAVMAFFAFNSLAQRTIDWSVEEISIPPTEIKTKPDNSGSDVIVQFVLQNNGNDTAHIGDTCDFRIEFVLTPSYKLYFPGPKASDYISKILSKQLSPGDTIIITLLLTTELKATISINVDLVVESYLYNRGSSNSITLETGTGRDNNKKSEKLVWYDALGHGVSVRNIGVDNTIFTIYPNPSDGIITISTIIKSGIDKNNILNIFDVNGRVVYTKQLTTSFSDENLDLSHLNNGLYYVELSNGETKTVSKLQIAK